MFLGYVSGKSIAIFWVTEEKVRGQKIIKKLLQEKHIKESLKICLPKIEWKSRKKITFFKEKKPKRFYSSNSMVI